MTKEIASILKRRLIGLPYFNVFAGIAQPVIDVKYAETQGEQASKITKKMPVSYDLVGGKSLYLGMDRQLVPNENKKGIVYFEDFGTQYDNTGSTRNLNFISNIRLVAWINKSKIDTAKYADITGLCIDQILKRLRLGGGINEDGIQRLFVDVTNIPIQDAAIFSRYNYNEEMMYLRPPFEYFAIDLRCKYSVGRVRCTGHQYVPGYMPVPVVALIVDNPDENNLQTLLNGDKVRKEYAPAMKLKILDAGGQPYMKGKFPLSSFVVDNIPFQNEPFDTQTGEFDHTEFGGFSSSNNPGVVTFDVNVPLK